MKTLKSIILGLALLVASTATYATKQTTPVFTKNDVLTVYVNAISHGKVEGVDGIFHKDVRHTIHRGEKEFNLDKKQILESLKANENIEQGCVVNTVIVDETDKDMVVKVTMKYEGYTRTNLITISSKKANFQITKIETLG
jgi:hypothetical protein